ncbi:MAG: hypothetical protein EHM27_07395, partial [Deltaproteobacteria bacterium]
MGAEEKSGYLSPPVSGGCARVGPPKETCRSESPAQENRRTGFFAGGDGAENMNIVFFQAAFFLYFIGAGVSLAHLVTLRPWLSRIGRGFLAGGMALHSLAILWRIFESGRTPLTNLHEALSFFAWATIGIYFLLHFKFRLEVLGAFVSPVAVVLMVLASLFPKEIVPVEPVLNSFWLPVHATLAIIGNAMFALAFAAGVMYLLQERQIKSKKIG